MRPYGNGVGDLGVHAGVNHRAKAYNAAFTRRHDVTTQVSTAYVGATGRSPLHRPATNLAALPAYHTGTKER